MRVQHSNARTREAMPPSVPHEKMTPREKKGSGQEAVPEKETLPEKIAANSVKSLTQWYPPFVLYAHPKIEKFLTSLFPPLEQVFDVGRKLVEAGKHLWSQVTAPLTGSGDSW